MNRSSTKAKRQGDQSLHLNGGVETEASLTTRIAEIYANELAHVIDYREELSNTEAWRLVWQKEIVPAAADEHAIASPEEGFAVFAEWAWLYPEETKKTYPQTWQTFERMGLI